MRAFARILRIAQTDAEHRLWYYLRASRLGGLKFRRQYPLPPYILDFYCVRAKLAIELDGSQHSAQLDFARTEFLQRNGIEVLRFWDNDVLKKTSTVLEQILASAQARTLTPNPSPGGRGETIKSSP